MSLANNVIFAIATAAPHRIFLETLTGLTTFLVSAGVLWLRHAILKKEQWILYFGVAFFIFSLQYLLPSGVHIYALIAQTAVSKEEALLLSLFASTASAANNVFFLAAALSLIHRQKIFPVWGIVLAAVTATIDIFNVFNYESRLPDALFSAFCLGFFGFSIFSKISRRRRLWLASLAFLGSLLYGAVNVFNALNLSWIEGRPTAEFTKNLASQAYAEGLLWGFFGLKTSAQGARHAGDTFVILLALPLKILMAGGVFILMIRSLLLISPRELHRALERVNQERTNFLMGEGILGAIGKTFDADLVTILFRLPGLKEKRILSISWSQEGTESASSPQVRLLPRSDESPEGFVLASGGMHERSRQRNSSEVTESKVIAPIKYHGMVTGCLGVSWKDRNAFTTTAVEQIQGLADLLGSTIEARRHLETLYYWSGKLQSFDYEAMAGGYRGVVAQLAQLVYDTLSPLSVALSFDSGFQPVWAVVGEHGGFSGDFEESRLNTETMLRLAAGRGNGPNDSEIRHVPIGVKGLEIGQLSIAWPSGGVDFVRPIVFPDELLLRTLSSQIAVSVLDAAHVGLWAILNRLQTKLSSPQIRSKTDWFSALEVAAQDAGLIWVAVAYLYPPSFDLEGPHAPIKLLQDLGFVPPDPSLSGAAIRLISLPENQCDSAKILELSLGNSKAKLWLGVCHTQFEHEIEGTLPWRTFLDRLVEAADAALSRITSKEEVQRIQDEADQYRSLVVATADTTTLIHDIKNLARNFQSAAQLLEDDRIAGELQAPYPTLQAIPKLLDSAQRLFRITDSVMTFQSLGRGSSCLLLEPLQELCCLVQPILDVHKICLHFEVQVGLRVGIPSHIVHQSIWTLVSNSIDSIKRGGNIWILADVADDRIVCHIKDDGSGIPCEVQAGLFKLGNSTKGTGGKGLFLVQQILEREGATIALVESSPVGTIFAISFPKGAEPLLHQ